MNKALVVFSGGQDSTTCLLQAIKDYDEVHTITFDYGQRHAVEVEVAQGLAHKLGAKSSKVLKLDMLADLTPSALTSKHIQADPADGQHSEMPNAFVPGRNIIFLAFAGIHAYQIGAQTLVTGVCETDFAGYPDCRQRFVESMAQSLCLGMDYQLEIKAPLMHLTKAHTWALADSLGVMDLIANHTLTCYNNILGQGCGDCTACELRRDGLKSYLENRESITLEMKGLIDNAS
ncbi:MAG: 7-cyano-7-deazaguanine synthase QueC [Vibrio sp.]